MKPTMLKIPGVVVISLSLVACATMNSPQSRHGGMYGPGAPGYYNPTTGRTTATEADVYQAQKAAALAHTQASEAHADLGVREHEVNVDRLAHRNEYLKAREQQGVTHGNIATYQHGTDAVRDTVHTIRSIRSFLRY